MVDGDKRKRSESRRGGTKKSLWAIDVQIQNVVLGFSPLPNQKQIKRKGGFRGREEKNRKRRKRTNCWSRLSVTRKGAAARR